MGPIDRMMKFLAQQRPEDMIHLFRPSLELLETLDLDKSQVFERTDTDSLYRVRTGDDEFLFHLEYIADWRPGDETIQLHKAARAHHLFRPLRVVSAALVFGGPAGKAREKRRIEWSVSKGASIFTYDIFRVEGIPAGRLLALEIPAAWALVPFCANGRSKAALVATVERIQSSPLLEVGDRRELLSAVRVGAEHRGVLAMIQERITEEELKGSTFFRWAYDEGRKEGQEELQKAQKAQKEAQKAQKEAQKEAQKAQEEAQRKALKTVQDTLVAVAVQKFGALPEEVYIAIRNLTDVSAIQSLILQAVQAPDLPALRSMLNIR